MVRMNQTKLNKDTLQQKPIPYSGKLTFQEINAKIDFFALILEALILGDVNFGDLNFLEC